MRPSPNLHWAPLGLRLLRGRRSGWGRQGGRAVGSTSRWPGRKRRGCAKHLRRSWLELQTQTKPWCRQLPHSLEPQSRGFATFNYQDENLGSIEMMLAEVDGQTRATAVQLGRAEAALQWCEHAEGSLRTQADKPPRRAALL